MNRAGPRACKASSILPGWRGSRPGRSTSASGRMRGPQRLPARAIEPIRFTLRDVALAWSAEAHRVVEIFPLGG